jgi:hypothetical protein
VRRRGLVIIGLALISVLGITLDPRLLGVPLGLLLLGVLPGVALADALFGPGGDLAERLLAVVGGSLATVVLGGLFLDVTVGITRTSFAVFLATVTIAATATGALLPRQADAQGPRPRIRISLPEMIAIVVAIALTVGAVAYARKPLHARGVDGYTILWIHPDGTRRVEVAVVSQELRTNRYLMVAVVSGTSVALQKWQLTLDPGGRWHAFVGQPTRGGVVQARLYIRRGGGWHPYRHVSLVL